MPPIGQKLAEQQRPDNLQPARLAGDEVGACIDARQADEAGEEEQRNGSQDDSDGGVKNVGDDAGPKNRLFVAPGQ